MAGSLMRLLKVGKGCPDAKWGTFPFLTGKKRDKHAGGQIRTVGKRGKKRL